MPAHHNIDFHPSISPCTNAEFVAALETAEKAHPSTTPKRDSNVVQVQTTIPVPAGGLAYLERPGRRAVGGDAAQIEHAPLQFTERDVADTWTRLTYINAHERNAWRDIGFAIHDIATWPEALRRAMWDKWSKEMDRPPSGEEKDKLFNQADQDKTWQSFGRNYTGTRITLATIIYLAKEAGWDGHTLKPLPDELSTFLPAVPAASPPPKLKIVYGNKLLSTKAPPRRWLVENWIPAAETTLLGGDGGTGKSTLVVQLGIAAVTGGNWFGREVEPCNVLYISAEDNEREIHIRFEQVTEHLNLTQDQAARFKVIDLTNDDDEDTDSTIALFDKNGQLKLTPLFSELEKEAREHNAGCIIFDASADVFGGDESVRREVRAFIRLLRRLAMRLDAAVILIAHPSVDGIKTGRGYSGSTHWNNAVRSRLYFTKAEAKEGAPPNPDLRVLELAKTNRARAGEQIHMTWSDGRFVLSSAAASRNLASEAEAEGLFLQLLEKTTKQGMNVSLSRSSTFAPSVFAKMSAAQGTDKAALEAAMHRLIEQGRIRNEAYGPPSKARHRLTLAVPATTAPGGNGAAFLRG
jgi:RecA-family ATPase